MRSWAQGQLDDRAMPTTELRYALSARSWQDRPQFGQW
jgi:hypothetical protein